jgi:NAD(P)-dependent dehydrogenase (short-subunit alcohol dehydrogenase family)
MNKKSRSVLITGANKGIGLALVKKLCSLEKFHIIMAFRSGNNGVK